MPAAPAVKKTDPSHPWRVRHVPAAEEQARDERLRQVYADAKPEVQAEVLARLLHRATKGDGVRIGTTRLTLKALREAQGVSLTDLAAQAGMQKSSLSRLENEDRNPTVKTLERIAAALGKRLVVRIEDLPEPGEAPPEPAGD
ncbi:helix-turn-helix domain-containing protein [Alienimonas californiensis]|uniref:Helix-turn-helix protein n=1 Tax=Alienimonas californiensis TaxID=2527989 RepID=A0A517P821_9PLAN|nr:helix-turn-helix transcriptional regulator [Alienimonas californiensis]QDT15523.1 helix-turn-helix protein [Alienimonas californiensis]